jgi:hypothetical protein
MARINVLSPVNGKPMIDDVRIVSSGAKRLMPYEPFLRHITVIRPKVKDVQWQRMSQPTRWSRTGL